MIRGLTPCSPAANPTFKSLRDVGVATARVGATEYSAQQCEVMCATNGRHNKTSDITIESSQRLLKGGLPESLTAKPSVDMGGTSEWEIGAHQLKVAQEIGRGQFGRVCSGTWQGTPVAMKVLYDTNMPKNREVRRALASHCAAAPRSNPGAPHVSPTQLLSRRGDPI